MDRTINENAQLCNIFSRPAIFWQLRRENCRSAAKPARGEGVHNVHSQLYETHGIGFPGDSASDSARRFFSSSLIS